MRPRLTNEQKRQLAMLSYAFGNRWKATLRTAWENGDYRAMPIGSSVSALQGLRNEIGVRGLGMLRTDDLV